jgi:hypothetical protein
LVPLGSALRSPFGTYSGKEFSMGNRDRQRKEPKKPKQPKKPTPASFT